MTAHAHSAAPHAGTALAPLRLKKREERRLRAGHLWVYSNEVDTRRTPLGQFEPGQPVEIQAANGRPLGAGYVNPHSLICARLYSRDARRVLDQGLLARRLRQALALRERLSAGPYYRLVHAESDLLPGLVVDRYGDVLVVQITTAGMERVRDAVLAALQQVLKPAGILLRNDGAVRQREGLPLYRETVGAVPAELAVVEGDLRFAVSAEGGQKTGWFFDQRDNRMRMRRYARGARVLDLFAYVGAWGLQAAAAGAESVLCVDESADALRLLENNARANGLDARVRVRRGDAFEVLRGLHEQRTRFDLIVLDPPAFIRRRKDVPAGVEAYHRLNRLAMQLLADDGFLVSASCSFHLEAARLQRVLLDCARQTGGRLQILEAGQQSVDHPVHPAIPETAYLKAFFCRLLS